MLLTTGGYHGTLAAVRALGRAGVPVVVADSDAFAVARWSCFTRSRVFAPPVRDKQDRFLDWLLAYGKRSRQRHVLLPTCDDTAWLYARHRDELSRHFHVSGCSGDAVYGLLNKRQLMAACREVGIDTPGTRSPSSEAELERVASDARYPVLIKPTSQVLFESRHKGKVVGDRAELLATHRRFRELRYGDALLAYDASVSWPLVQEYFSTADRSIYNLSGYIGRDPADSVLRASRKVLQEREIGVGICFERAQVHAELVQAVRALFARLGYHGIFEIEFIPAHGRFYLIDANPRFYGELAFDVARNMPLPLIAYFDALGDMQAVRALIAAATELPDAPRAHMYRVGFEMYLRTQRFSGALSVEQQRVWRDWQAAQGALSDAVHDGEDWVPSLIETAKRCYLQLRFPAELIQQTARHRFGFAR